MYSALDVTRYIIWYCQEKSYAINNLKLQKILYFAQAQFLVFGKDNKPCFFEEIEAWKYGPVVPDIYRAYKIFGSAHIPCEDMMDDFDIDEPDKEMINGIVDRCNKYAAVRLIDISCKQAPWKDAYESRKTVIDIDEIRKYFLRKRLIKDECGIDRT